MRKHTPEEAAAAKARVNVLRVAYRNNPEYKSKQAARDAARYTDPERKAARVAYFAARRATPEFKAAQAARDAARYMDPEYRAAKAARDAARRARPGFKEAAAAYSAAYRATPEFKIAQAARDAARYSAPGYKGAAAAYDAARNARPEARAAQAARRATPEYKEAKTISTVARNALPEVKAARRAADNARNATPLGNLMSRLRARTKAALKRGGFKKGTKTEKMLGCGWEFLKSHIEEQFTDGMNWDNRSQWHIDHIIPLASAKDEESIVKLCHYSNLQPLWGKDNLSKGAKMPFPITA